MLFMFLNNREESGHRDIGASGIGCSREVHQNQRNLEGTLARAGSDASIDLKSAVGTSPAVEVN